ncbi:MAG: carbon storage regulator CsrA [Negativicutes bacterium]|nr:carbon storage regulator CsrA [Negativicutes bacterium]
MLVLSRKAGEKIFIGDKIVLTIIETRGDNIRVAIDAPKDIKIYRGEIYEAIAAENKEAATPAKTSVFDSLKNIYKGQ